MSLVRYFPRAPLDRYVECFWWSRREIAQSYFEHMLPSGQAQLVFALHDGAFSCITTEQKRVLTWSGSLLHGPQWGHYLAGPKPPGSVVGVSFRAGCAGAILGVPAAEVAGRHVPLPAIWGRRAEVLRERLMATTRPMQAFTLLERHLSARIELPLLMHPAIAGAMASAGLPERISHIQRSTGFSSRHFIALFRASVGLTPKHYFRIRRFNEVARRLASALEEDLTNIAADLGYCDQAHLTREFRELAGITPGTYRGRPDSPLHHPRRAGEPAR